MREVSNALDFCKYHSSRAGVKPPFSALRHQNSMDQSSLIERDGVRTLEEARFLHLVVTLLQVERGGEVFRTSCDICCESVPLLRQPGRSLTCEVRGFNANCCQFDWMAVLKMQTTNKDNN